MLIIIKRYLANTNLHGIRYLVEDGFHWTERLFWLITCGLCWFGCAIMIQDSLDVFYNRPVAFTAETTYLDWQTEFPSISVCMRPHTEAMQIAANSYKQKFGVSLTPNAFSWLFDRTFRTSMFEKREELLRLTAKDILGLYKEATIKCSRLMDTCYWRFEKFNCCDEFKPLRTENGLCYVFNSKYTNGGSTRNKYIINQTTASGELLVSFTNSAGRLNAPLLMVSIHNNLELPTMVGKNDREIMLTLNTVSSVYFSVVDVYNDPALRYVSPKKRGCRFASETENFNVYQYYSNDGCGVQVQMENMLKTCHCVSHLFPYTDGMPVCNYTGLVCIEKHSASKIADEDMEKRCLPDCEGFVVRRYQNNKVTEVEPSTFNVHHGIVFKLLALPTLRHKRYVVRSLLDIVVAVGSAAGLFMGAGILSIVEIPYWLLLRHGS